LWLVLDYDGGMRWAVRAVNRIEVVGFVVVVFGEDKQCEVTD
jgi:hypothetical protein